jgi:hypothetical protein
MTFGKRTALSLTTSPRVMSSRAVPDIARYRLLSGIDPATGPRVMPPPPRMRHQHPPMHTDI